MNPKIFDVDGVTFRALFYWGPNSATVAVSCSDGKLLFRDRTAIASNVQAGYRSYFGKAIEQSFISDAIDRFTHFHRSGSLVAVSP